MTSPAKASAFSDFVGAVKDDRGRIKELADTTHPTFETAMITTYLGGPVCTVTYLSGRTRVLPFLADWAPTTETNVLILNSPGWTGIIGPISAFNEGA